MKFVFGASLDAPTWKWLETHGTIFYKILRKRVRVPTKQNPNLNYIENLWVVFTKNVSESSLFNLGGLEAFANESIFKKMIKMNNQE